MHDCCEHAARPPRSTLVARRLLEPPPPFAGMLPRVSRTGRRPGGRTSSAPGGAGRRLGACAAGPGRSRIPLLLLGLHEVAAVRRIEIKQGAARGEVLDEGLADR